MKFLVLAASIATSVAAGGIEQSTLKSYVSSNHERFLTDLREHSNRILSPDTQVKPTIRRLAGAGEGSYFCDIQFMECLGHPKCTSCFSELQDSDIDWSIIAPSNSKCDVVINALMDKVGICKSLQLDDKEKETFCKTFDSCVIWKSGDDSDHTDPSSGNDDSDKNHIDCSELTKCEWDGMKPSYIGDGVCHEFIDGCYNTAICGYDGGDCCPETCKNSTEFVGCGSDGYFCRNTTSPNCEEKVCGKNKDGKDKPDTPAKPIPDCGENKAPYKLFLYDSFGDGWDRTEMKVTDRDDNTHSAIFDGRLEDGSEGLEYLCLSKTTACYQVNLSGGFWGNEVSWQIKPMRKGAPDIASGGAPMDCEFAVGGAQHCENTCTGRSNVDPEEDEKYHTYHKMADCIERECILQLAMCEDDVVCTSCLNSASTPAYCMADDIFNALAFCTECKCVEGINESEKEMFCKDKSRDKHESEQTDDDSINPTIPDDSSSKRVRACSYDEFTKGSAAVINYSECSGIETFAALLTDFDPDNFGMLDSFETCASEYKKGGYGKNALDCMRILEDAIMNPTKGMDQSKIDKGVPKEAISALAEDLLTNGEQFCECSSDASEGLAPCKDFIHFKTLLYESIDACKGLDAIDCDAWAEFYKPCRSNMEDKFKNIDFKKSKQCEYIKNGCGNVGPFPSFRRLDCDREITKEAWDFYLDYDDKCNTKAVPKSKPKPSKPPPTPAPPTPSSHGGISTSMPTKASDRKYDPSHTSPTSSGNKKYVPPEKRNSGSGGFISKIANFFVWIFKITLFCCLAAGAYWLYKNKFADFDYSRFRRARNYGADNNGMYDSLTMENAGASFQPPTLPPPPSSYDNSGGNNGMYNMNVGGFA